MFIEDGQNTGTGIGAWAGSQKYSKLEKLVRHFKEGRRGRYMFGVRMRSLTWSVHLECPLMAWRARGQMGYSGGKGVQEGLPPWHLKDRRGAAWWSGNKGRGNQPEYFTEDHYCNGLNPKFKWGSKQWNPTLSLKAAMWMTLVGMGFLESERWGSGAVTSDRSV